MTVAARHRPRCLVLRPTPAPGGGVGGDEVIYGKSIPYLIRSMDVESLELGPVSTAHKLLNVIAINPPECSRFISKANRDLVSKALAQTQFDLAFLFNEASFPMLAAVERAGVPAVLVAQNTHSLVAATDPSPVARLIRPIAVAFEQRWYASPAAQLIVISRADMAGLQRAGVRRDDILLAPAGAPPPSHLTLDAPVLRKAVITGSYGWWRKRRNLGTFAAGSPLGAPAYAVDPLALDILGAEGRPLNEAEGRSWEAGLRFGVVTDIFPGGFKLKSLEYVARNCVVLSLPDIRLSSRACPMRRSSCAISLAVRRRRRRRSRRCALRRMPRSSRASWSSRALACAGSSGRPASLPCGKPQSGGWACHWRRGMARALIWHLSSGDDANLAQLRLDDGCEGQAASASSGAS